jgi:PAS domain-containing protein
MRGEVLPPALDGLRPDERRVMSLLTAWKNAAAELAGDAGHELVEALEPLLAQFRLALRTSSSGRRRRASAHAPRRVVAGAIDRVADGFLAIDVSAATIVDANPAAGALLGVDRDSLFGLDLMGFVPQAEQAQWWSHLDAVAESHESLYFNAALRAVSGDDIGARATATAFVTRGRTLALVMLRPQMDAAASSEARKTPLDPLRPEKSADSPARPPLPGTPSPSNP